MPEYVARGDVAYTTSSLQIAQAVNYWEYVQRAYAPETIHDVNKLSFQKVTKGAHNEADLD
eukprot:1639177-Karenia_brevis.AAC.1